MNLAELVYRLQEAVLLIVNLLVAIFVLRAYRHGGRRAGALLAVGGASALAVAASIAAFALEFLPPESRGYHALWVGLCVLVILDAALWGAGIIWLVHRYTELSGGDRPASSLQP
ncbi:MAG TPA: hypothetical protein VEB66_15195 [Opitutaceae bacterium]|nr:hypothetical protein [Opitutaceae bacterium]